MSRSKSWPLRVKSGHSTVSIYRIKRKKNGRFYEEFKLAFYDELGKRKFQSFSDVDRARAAADNLHVGFRKGEVKSLLLSNDDKVVYLRALKALEPIGTPLDLAAHQFAQAAKLLGGVSLLEAAREYAKRHPATLPRKTVQETKDEFLESRRRAGRDEHYIDTLKSHLKRFSEAFHIALADLTRGEVSRFLNNLELGARSRYNYAKSLRTFFSFAQEQGYLPRDHDLQGISAGDADPGEIEIYQPGEMAALLRVARPELVPVLVLGGFAGLRSAEVERLDWSEVQMGRGFIELKRTKTKTAQRRLVPIAPNLAQWLAPYIQKSGQVWVGSRSQLVKLKEQTAQSAGLEWRHNALRHSFASYRLAQIQNANQVALETGHTVQILFSNYRELVTPDEAKSWFDIAPERIGPVEIYRPEEMQALLAAAPVEVTPALGLCAFSGLSRSEVERLDWAEVDLGKGFIELKALKPDKAKAARLIPILSNLAGWLKGVARSSGPVWSQTHGSPREVLIQTAQRAGVGWKENGLDHSYVSYRLALIPAPAQVAAETGRSPHAVLANFGGVVTSQDAQRWFSLLVAERWAHSESSTA